MYSEAVYFMFICIVSQRCREGKSIYLDRYLDSSIYQWIYSLGFVGLEQFYISWSNIGGSNNQIAVHFYCSRSLNLSKPATRPLYFSELGKNYLYFNL